MTKRPRQVSRAMTTATAFWDELEEAGWTGPRRVTGHDCYGQPILCWAANARSAWIPKLLAMGATLNAVDENDCTPLMVAAGRNAYGAVGALLAAGADPNFINKGGISALRWCAMRVERPDAAGRKTMQVLLRAGADPRLPLDHGQDAIELTAHLVGGRVLCEAVALHTKEQMEAALLDTRGKPRGRM